MIDILKKWNWQLRPKNVIYQIQQRLYYFISILAIYLHPILLSNRAAAFIKRNWNGDVYSALLDSYKVIDMDPTHIKSHLRYSNGNLVIQ